jgi:hypothetical protein
MCCGGDEARLGAAQKLIGRAVPRCAVTLVQVVDTTGGIVTVNGTGFGSQSSAVTVLANGVPLASTVRPPSHNPPTPRPPTLLLVRQGLSRPSGVSSRTPACLCC